MHAKNVKNYAKLLKTTTKFAVSKKKIPKIGQNWPKNACFWRAPCKML